MLVIDFPKPIYIHVHNMDDFKMLWGLMDTPFLRNDET